MARSPNRAVIVTRQDTKVAAEFAAGVDTICHSLRTQQSSELPVPNNRSPRAASSRAARPSDSIV
jgi:hypothetical protein